jgi:hypothetical protein
LSTIQVADIDVVTGNVCEKLAKQRVSVFSAGTIRYLEAGDSPYASE